MNNKDIISKIKEKAYENVNKKIEEEKKETERKINSEIDRVEEILKYINNKLLFKKIGNSYYSTNYTLVTEDIFFQDYSTEPKDSWCSKGVSINHERKNKYECFIKVNGEQYYDVRYIMRDYEETYENARKRLQYLNDEFRKIEDYVKDLNNQELKIKTLLEKYQQVEINEKESVEEIEC